MTGNGTKENPWDLETALASISIEAGHTLNLFNDDLYNGDFTVGLFNGEEESVITIQPATGTNPIINGSLLVLYDWIIIKNLHIKDLDFLTRITEISGSNPEDIPANEAISVFASNVIIQDCILENCRQGLDRNSTVQNLILDGCIIFHNGWTAPDRPHGHGMYLRGITGTVKNCISFSNFEFGIKIYDEGTIHPRISNYTVEDNIVFNNSVVGGKVRTRGNILYGHSALNFDSPILRRNYTYQLPENMVIDEDGYVNTNHLGYNVKFTNAIFDDNYMPDGIVVHDETSTYISNSNNVLIPEETNKIVIISIRNKLHVAIYNWEGLDSVDVDVSSLLDVGDNYNLINVQDYFVDIATGTTGETQIITVDMRAISHTVAAPQGLDAPSTTFPTFGCFVVEKS